MSVAADTDSGAVRWRLIGQSARLAVADLLAEKGLSACFIAALVAVLTPLLVLFGLKFGLIDTMTTRLTSDPRNLEITPIGAGRYDGDWFDAMAARDDVGFVIPRTRQIATTVDLTVTEPGRAAVVTVELVPSAAGDPVLALAELAPPSEGEIVLSDRAAQTLDVAAGDTVEGIVVRTRDSGREIARVPLTVAGVLPPVAFARAAAFAPLDLLVAAEDFRDGRAVPAWGYADDPPPPTPRIYASFRLYAGSMDDVAQLQDDVLAGGQDVRSRLADIDAIQNLDRSLSAIFWIIAIIGGAGYAVSLAASLWANVERKRQALSVLQLIGLQRRALVAFPVSQSLGIALAGGIGAIALAYIVGAIINGVFASELVSGESVCRIHPLHALAGLALTLAVAGAAATAAGRRVVRISPAEGLRAI